MNLTVRVADRRDIPHVVGLLAEMDATASTPAPAPPMSVTRAERLFREMARYPDYRCYLAFEGTQAIGTFTLLIFDALVHGGTREALLDGVVVTASRRGEGLGRAMMQEAMRLALNAGCYKLALSSNIKRKEAHRFYESLGFQQHGISFAIGISEGSHAAAAGGNGVGLITL